MYFFKMMLSLLTDNQIRENNKMVYCTEELTIRLIF